MRILFIIMNFPPSIFGGQASCMYPVLKELSKSQNDIKVLTTNYKIPKDRSIITDKWIKIEGITINYIKTHIHNALSLKFLYVGFFEIKNSDQIHLNGFFYFPNLIFLILNLALKKVICISPHGELFSPALKIKYWKKKPYLLIMQFLARKTNFRATSSDEAIQIKNYFPKSNISIIPNFFDLKPNLNVTKLKQFIFLGRICKIKRIENLIIACTISKFFIPHNYILLIAGPKLNQFTKYYSHLEELVKLNKLNSNILFLGEIHPPKIEKLLAQSKALFLVSDSENFGNVVVESLAQGTPVVASKGTPWKSLIDRKSGFWINNSPESIALTMDEIILMDNESYKTMSKNSIAFSQEYTKDKILPKWIELINEIDICSKTKPYLSPAAPALSGTPYSTAF